ncbi:hypothetical protein EC973_005188 [Apophysomyces ossiformis]|uniref:mRNA decay factor PAT1 domain-containing protein n=1 Tax=Apophysomyces ossiformis TaxID=679940 RepID=A0A8H7EUK3_9FUNG|nr:hypothetical protein EC973_005188 [Apophysomyces ossiformis]
MPPLSDDELRKLDMNDSGGSQTNNNGGPNMRGRDNRAVEDADVYDFETLQAALHDDEEHDDGLGDQLDEEGDDLNDETFGSGPIGQDFDFASSTEKFNSAVINEDEAFFSKRKFNDERTRSRDAQGSMAQISGRQAGHSTGDMRTGVHRQYVDSSPVTQSIWGNFAGNLSSERGFGSIGGTGNLSPFATGARPQSHQQKQSYTPSPPPGLSPSSSFGHQQRRSQPVLLEDIEAELQRQATTGRFRQETPRYLRENADMGKKMLSLAEVEAAMVGGGRAAGHSMFQQPPQSSQTSFARDQEFRSASYGKSELAPTLQERDTHVKPTHEKSRYSGLMTQHDKDFINRIQMAQLATEDPFTEDFYYQVFTSLRQRAGLPTWSTTHITGDTGKGGRGRREENAVQRMQQQLQRIVNEAKRRPKHTQGVVSLEGALGKITSLTVRNPRQVLQVSDKKSSSGHEADQVSSEQKPSSAAVSSVKPSIPSVNGHRRTLKAVESLYLIVLELEQMRRQGVPRSKTGYQDKQEEDVDAWKAKYAEVVDKLWNSLEVLDSADNSTPLLVSILSVNKGKKLIPRIVRHLNSDQNLTMITVIVANFARLQVCRHVIYPGTMVADAEEAKRQQFVTFEDVELFMNTTVPPLLAFIAEVPLRVVNGLLQVFMEKNDIETIARSRPGLAFLTMLLSRAEILKQGGGSLLGLGPPNAEELAQWQEMYARLYNSLKGRYASIFPSLYYLVPSHPGTSMMQISLELDDMYVWQFLAAIAVGASMDEQHILVTEVRDRVMENIVLANSNRLAPGQATHRINNVNLFLHALGLDASQVSVPR